MICVLSENLNLNHTFIITNINSITMVFKVLIAAAFVVAAGVSAVEPEMIGKDLTLSCPLLTCDGNISPGTCYEHDGGASAKRIKGALCYDKDTAKQTDKQLVCPFNTKNFMWIDELYQGQADKLPSIVYGKFSFDLSNVVVNM